MRRSEPNTPPRPPKRNWRTPLLPGLLFVALLIAYWPALRGGFIWDDDAYVTNNPLLTAPDGWQRIWFSTHRQSQFFPLVYSTLRIEHSLWGLNPFGYHLVNVLLHAVNALLVWLLLRRLAVPGAWIAAALFAFHPVHVESVAWVTELKNTQSTLFFLLALLAWFRFLRPGPPAQWQYYGLALLLYVFALLSKTTACTLVAALLLIPWMRGERIGRRKILQLVPFVILGVAAGLVSIWWESHLGNYTKDVGQNLTLLERTLIAARALWFYVAKLLLPVNLTFSYQKWEVTAGDVADYVPLLGCVAVAFALWRWRKTLGRPAIGAVVFFVATLLPLLGFIPLYTFRFSYVADHYQYVASIGLLALAAAALGRAHVAVPAVLLVFLAGLTWKQAHIYQNQTVLWEDTLSKNPSSWLAHNNLGIVFNDEGEIQKAMQHYREALRLNPDFAEAHYNLGIALFKTGQTNDAMKHFEEALRSEPRDSRARFNYAVALDKTGQTAEAIQQYEEAVRLDPDYVAARLNLGIVFSRQGSIDEALAQFHEAVRLSPNDAEARNNLGAVLRAKGRLDDAIGQFREAVRLNPNHALAQANLGAALLDNGRADEAIRHLGEAVRLNPDDDASRDNLSRALEMKAGSTIR